MKKFMHVVHRIVFALAVSIRDMQSLSEFHSEQAIAHQRNLNKSVEVSLLEKAMIYYVYIFYSNKLDRFYIGSTQNIEERLKSHLFNHTGFTSRAKDWELCYSETYASKEKGLECERQIKKWKSRNLIEKLVQYKNN